MKKPQHVLTQLEREPIVYFGCTWTEIKSKLLQAFVICLILSSIICIVLSRVGFSFNVIFPVFMLLMILGSLGLTMLLLKSIDTMRSGKPLFYEKHVQTHKGSCFIQPKNIVYQRERNDRKK